MNPVVTAVSVFRPKTCRASQNPGSGQSGRSGGGGDEPIRYTSARTGGLLRSAADEHRGDSDPPPVPPALVRVPLQPRYRPDKVLQTRIWRL